MDRLRDVRRIGLGLAVLGVSAFGVSVVAGRDGDAMASLAFAAVGLLLLVVHRYVAGPFDRASKTTHRLAAVGLVLATLGTAQVLWGVVTDTPDVIWYGLAGATVGVVVVGSVLVRERSQRTG